MLYYQGQFIESALYKNRVLKSVIMQAIRSNGFSSMEDVEAVVFETNGSMLVIKRSSSNSKTSTLSDIDSKKS
nr:YetF domain-containing protein [Cytobacillus oceanisediminis]